MRWMYVKQNPSFNLNFGWKAADETKRKLLTLWNSFIFLQTYSNRKDFSSQVIPKSSNILDEWILSRLNNMIERVSQNLNKYNIASASLDIENFFTEDLSLWYIRRSRRRFHPAPEPSGSVRGRETKKDYKAAAQTLYYVILELMKIMAPFLPFLTEEIYQNLKVKGMPESIHLFDWPEANGELINRELEEKMEKIREIAGRVLAKRAKAGIKVRQPLNELQITNRGLKNEKELLDLLREEVNVKKITFGVKLKLDTKITARLKEEGEIREVVRHLQEMRKQAGLTSKDKISIRAAGEPSFGKILKRNRKTILKQTLARDFSFKEKPKGKLKVKKEMVIDGARLWLGIDYEKKSA
jgi:isoleucyl-tRNA synthetase